MVRVMKIIDYNYKQLEPSLRVIYAAIMHAVYNEQKSGLTSMFSSKLVHRNSELLIPGKTGCVGYLRYCY